MRPASGGEQSGTILVVCGLNREAALAGGPGILTVAGGGRSRELRARLDRLDAAHLRAVVSFGLAGALDARLAVGTAVLPEHVGWSDDRVAAHPALRARWAELLGRAGETFAAGSVAGADIPALTALSKGEILARTGASIVDMESHVAAAFARACDLPFLALRVISDPADRDLPAVAGEAMRPDGSVDVLRVMRGLARDPGQIGPLLATGRDAAVAFRTLRRVRGLLGLRLGLDL